MFERDLLVALIALLLGTGMLFAAIANFQRVFQMRTPKFLANRFGIGKARMIIGFVGAIVLAMGIYILYSSPAVRQKFSQAQTSCSFRIANQSV